MSVVCAELMPLRQAIYFLVAFCDLTHFVLKLWGLKQRGSKHYFVCCWDFAGRCALKLNKTQSSFWAAELRYRFFLLGGLSKMLFTVFRVESCNCCSRGKEEWLLPACIWTALVLFTLAVRTCPLPFCGRAAGITQLCALSIGLRLS